MDTRTKTDALTRAQSVAPAVRDAAGEIERLRELPASLLEKLHDARLFRLLLPAAVGGDEVDPVTLSKVTETIAAEDASTAWCLGQASGCAMSAAFLSPEAAQEIFGPRNAVLAWGAGIQGKAVVVEGGYRVTGRWTFASGSRHATWLGGHSFIVEADGTQRLHPDGRKVDRTMLFARDKATIEDDWHVVGLRGTGSDSYTVNDLFIPEAHTVDREDPAQCRSQADVYQLTTTQVYASAFAGVMLGITRGMLSNLRALALTKTPRGASSSLLENQMFHGQLADLEARYGAARAYLHTTQSEIWDVVTANQNLSLDQRARVRLATTHAINQGADVVAEAYRLAGQNAIFEGGNFERRLRDANAASQQVQGRKTHYATVGRVMLGLEPDATMFL